FDIVNKTKHTLTLVGVDGAGIRDDYPRNGTTVAPGKTLHYEKVYYFAQRGETTLRFTYSEPLDGGGSRISAFEVRVVVDALSATNIFTDADTFFTVDKHGAVGADTIDLLEKEASEITVPKADAQKQAELLNQTCASGLAVCTFEPTSKTTASPQLRLVAGGPNNTSTPATGSLTIKTVATSTSSVETTGSAKLTINGILEAGLSEKYGKSWTSTREVTRTEPYTVGAYMDLSMYSKVVMERVTGNFTVRLGKTTWNLDGVYFDVPNPDADVLFIRDERPLTAQEKASLPHHIDITPSS
ncbi:MAG: hypothetical protein JSS74_08735, partial [Actinobacteria bacterium]|nr:hypothetical protein [Actinomycetota bacterium]